MADINFTGLASGIDTSSIISQLMMIERQPLIKLQQRSSLYSARKTALQDINTKLLSIYNASRTLLSALEDTWNQKTVSVSNTSLLGITATADADKATYTIEINKLAQAHTVASGQQTSSSTALYISGKIYVNGKEIDIVSTDSLTDIKNKINNTADVGATASIVDNTLRIKSSSTGATQLILADELAATTKNISSTDIGVVSGIITGNPGPASYDFVVNQLAQKHEVASNAVADPAAALGMTGTALVNGLTISVLATDSLNGIKDKINAAGAGVSAYIDATNTLRMQSQTWGVAGEIVASDSAGTVFQNLGILNADNVTFKNTILAAQDAGFTVDGTAYTRSTNTFSDVITDVNVTLAGVGSATLTITADGGVLRTLGVLNSDGTIKNELLVGQDAEIDIDGQIVTRSSNVFSDVVSGLTFTLKGQTTEAITVGVSQDEDLIKSKITDFVNAYNTAYKLIGDKLTEATVKDPKTEADRNMGMLRNDMQLRMIKREIRWLIADPVTSQPADMQFLEQIGITTDRDGQLLIDDAELASALEADPDKLKDLFTAEYGADPYDQSAAGLATRLDNYLGSLTNSLTGEFFERGKTIDNQIELVAKSIEKWETKLLAIEAKYKKQFIEMEKAMQAMQSQGKWLAQLSSQLSIYKTSGSSSSSTWKA